MKPLFLLVVFFLIPAFNFAQQTNTVSADREIDSLINLNRTLTNQRKFEQAHQAIDAAKNKTISVFGMQHETYASCLHNQGRTFSIQGLHAAAEPLYIEAMSIREKTLGKEHPDYISSLNNLANLYYVTENYQKAESLYSEILTIREKTSGKENNEYAAILISIANLYQKTGNYKKAEPIYLEAISIREKVLGKEHPQYAYSLGNLANLYRSIGEYEKAEPLYLEAKSILGKALGKEHTEYGTSLMSLGALYHDIGAYGKAEPLFFEAVTIQGKVLGKKHPGYAASLNNLALLYKKMGAYEKAEPLYLEAKTIWEKVLGKEHSDYAANLNNLATLYMEMGNFEKAEPLYLEAKAIREKVLGNEHTEYALSLNNLAVLYKKMGNCEKAEPLYLEAKAIQEKALGKEHSSYALSVNNLAVLYKEMGNYKKAEPLYLEATAIREKVLGKEHPDYAQSLNNLGNLYLTMGVYEKAESLHLATKAIRENVLGKAHPDYALSLNNLANLYRIIGRYEAGEPLLLEANAIYRNLITKSSQHLSERELSSYISLFLQDIDVYFSFAQTDARRSEELFAGCYDNALFHKGFLLVSSNRLKRLTRLDVAASTQFELLISFLRRLATEYAKPTNERRNVMELEEKANDLEKELARTVAGFGEALRQVTWQEVQKQLKPGEISVEFIHYQFYNPKPTNSIYYSALVLRPGDAAPVFVPLFEEGQLKALLEGVTSRTQEQISLLYDAQAGGKGQKLHDLVWKPLENLLQGAQKIYCSPSGVLHRLNLGAIPAGDSQPFGERHELVLLSSTRQLVVQPTPGLTQNNATAYLVGGVRYATDSTAMAFVSTDLAGRGMPLHDDIIFKSDTTTRGNEWRYLPNSLDEVRDVNQFLQNVNYRTQLDTGYMASEEAFKRLGAGQLSPRIVLVSTHGFFYPDPNTKTSGNLPGGNEPVFKTSTDPMMRSGLILAGAQQAWSSGKALEYREDGILTAYEISQMNLSNTELVVLSACETGLGDIEGNEGVYGLQRAFKIAGAKNLIMSLWSVNDKSSRLLITEFYRQWLENKLSIREAFQEAQRLMRLRYPDSAYHWAGFVLIE